MYKLKAAGRAQGEGQSCPDLVSSVLQAYVDILTGFYRYMLCYAKNNKL